MSTPCITSFGMMRKVQGLPGSVILIEEEPALSSGTFASAISGMIASVASEHSSPMTTSGLYCRQRAAARVLVFDLELVAVDARLVDQLERELDALLVLHAEIRSGAGDRQQRADLDGLVLRMQGRRDDGDGRRGQHSRGEATNTQSQCHGSCSVRMFAGAPMPGTQA